MADNPADHPLDHPHVRHEEHDVNVVAVTKFGIGLSLMIIASVFVLWGLFNFFKNRLQAEYGPETPLIATPPLPPSPRLQSSPVAEMQSMRAAEEQELHSYGWVDRQKGIVRIPIDRAMDILAQRGLPARPAPPQGQGSK